MTKTGTHAVIKENVMTEVWVFGAGNNATENLERQRRNRQLDLKKKKTKTERNKPKDMTAPRYGEGERLL